MNNLLEDNLLERVVALLKARDVEAYLVGGTVRDWLMGRPIHDLDFAVRGDAMALGRRAADALNGAYVPLDLERNTSRVVVKVPPAAGPDQPVSRHVDFAGLRGDDIEGDLWARDFTVNAMAIDILDVEQARPPVLDPTGGQEDLSRRRVRAVSETIFEDDPVRLLRAVRFAAQLQGYIEPDTQALMRQHAALLPTTSPERIRDELVKILLLPASVPQVRLLEAFGILEIILPEVVALQGVTQSPPHVYDVYDHTLMTLAAVERVLGALLRSSATALPEQVPPDAPPAAADFLGPVATYAPELREHVTPALVGDRPRLVLLKLVALLHDVGKPAARSVDPDGRVRFLRHEHVGSKMAARVMRRLRFGGREVRLVAGIVRHHIRPLLLGDASQVTRRAVYRFFRDAGSAGLDTLLFSLADYRATCGPTIRPEGWARRLDVAQLFLKRYFLQHSQVVTPPKLIDGNDLMRVLDLEPGRQIGLLLEAVREAQAAGLVATREEALTLAEGLLQDAEALEALAAGAEEES